MRYNDRENAAATIRPFFLNVFRVSVGLLLVVRSFRLLNSFLLPETLVPWDDDSRVEGKPAAVLLVGDKHSATVSELESLREKLLGPDLYGGPDCPPGCGCPKTRTDCPRHYDVADVKSSAIMPLNEEAAEHVKRQLAEQHAASRKACAVKGNLAGHGGWCLGQVPQKGTVALPNGKVIGKPNVYAGPSQRICIELEEFIRNENVTSIADFGAGYGPYGAYLVPKFPQLTYRAYDGAGDIEEITGGFVRYVDLSMNLDLPPSDWVFSLEVGEHVPSKFEGIFMRNLHRHNCRGIILSWANLGQNGNNHVNNHSNEYITAVLEELDYVRDPQLEAKLRNPKNNHFWFKNSVMVFRRKTPVCY